MNTPSLLLIIAIGLGLPSACKKSEQTNECTPEKRTFSFQTAMHINRTKVDTPDPLYEHYNYTVNAGDKIVFNYKLDFKDCPQFADDEGSRIVLFEIPVNLNNFQIKDSTGFAEAKALIVHYCLCSYGGPIGLKRGFIEGQKINDKTWHIKASLSPFLNTTQTLDFETDFRLN